MKRDVESVMLMLKEKSREERFISESRVGSADNETEEREGTDGGVDFRTISEQKECGGSGSNFKSYSDTLGKTNSSQPPLCIDCCVPLRRSVRNAVRIRKAARAVRAVCAERIRAGAAASPGEAARAATTTETKDWKTGGEEARNAGAPANEPAKATRYAPDEDARIRAAALVRLRNQPEEYYAEDRERVDNAVAFSARRDTFTECDDTAVDARLLKRLRQCGRLTYFRPTDLRGSTRAECISTTFKNGQISRRFWDALPRLLRRAADPRDKVCDTLLAIEKRWWTL